MTYAYNDYKQPGNPIECHVRGKDIYFIISMPVVPRKGDILVLNSLSGGVYKDDVLVSRVEWVMNYPNRFIHAWIKVRKVSQQQRRGEEE